MARTYNENTQFNAIPGLATLKSQLVREKADADARSKRASHAGIMSAASRGTLSRKLVDKSVHEDVRGCVKPPVRAHSRVIVRESKPESLDKIARLAREQAQGKRGSTHRLYTEVMGTKITGRAVAGVVDAAREHEAERREAAREAKRVMKRLAKLRKDAASALNEARFRVANLDRIRKSNESFEGNYWRLQRDVRKSLRDAFIAEHKLSFASKPGHAFKRAPWAEMPNYQVLRQLRTPVSKLMLDQDYAPGELRR